MKKIGITINHLDSNLMKAMKMQINDGKKIIIILIKTVFFLYFILFFPKAK